MYCILITGVPAAGKSTIAAFLASRLSLPVISKDSIKERLFDAVGFQSRQEKVRLGVASMDIQYYVAEQLMEARLPFILENNFENISRAPLLALLEKHGYLAVTVHVTGDLRVLHQRFLDRDRSPERHRGHVVNDCYPEKPGSQPAPPLSYEGYVSSVKRRGMDVFAANGPRIVVDTTDFAQVNLEALLRQIIEIIPSPAPSNP